MTLNAKVSFDTFGKELGRFGLRKFVILRHDFFFGSDSKLMELQNFSQLIVDS